MSSKIITLILLLIGISCFVKAQDSKNGELLPFDTDKFNDRFKNFHELNLDTLHLKSDSASLNINNQYSMRILKVPEDNLAPMPMMSIDKDVHYTMLIKKYKNYYSPISRSRKKDELFKKEDLLPLEVPEEK